MRRLWRASPQEWLAALVSGKRGSLASRQAEVSRYVWCLSTGRVGTKTLAALGALAGEIDARHEPKPLLYGLGRMAYLADGNEEVHEVLREALGACRSPVGVYQHNICLETSPQGTFLAGQLKELFSQSRFIHIVRHPGSVIRSGMRRGWYNGHDHDRWRITPRTGTAAADSWERWSILEKNAWLWAETNRWIRSFLETLPREERLVIRSEDLFKGDEVVVRDFYEQLGAAVPSKQKLEKVLGKTLNRQKTGNFPEWKDWSDEQFAVVGPHVEELMAYYSYPFRGPQ